MPVNFEIDFIQPLLKDLENGKFANVQEYAEGLTKYYMRTISKGAPIGIPPTLPSPAASGAPAPVGTGPSDVFGKPFVEGSRVRFLNTIDQYYTAREIVLSKENLEAKRRALEGIIRQAEYQTKLLQSTIRRVKDLKDQIAEIPQNIKDTIEGIKEMFNAFLQQLLKVREDVLGFDFEELQQLGEDFSIEEEFKTRFPDEAAIIDSLLNIDFGNIRQTITTIQKAGEYFNRINANTQSTVKAFQEFDQEQQKQYVQRRLQQSVTKIVRLANGLLVPESLGELIGDIRRKGEKFDERVERKIDKAIVASDRLGFIKFYVKPELEKLEKLVKNKEKLIKEKLVNGAEKIKEAIDKKAREIAEKQAKKKSLEPSEKIKTFKAKKEQADELRKKIKNTVDKTVKAVKTGQKLVQKSTAIVNASLKIKDDAVAAVKQLEGDVEKLKTSVEKNIEDVQEIRFPDTPNPDRADINQLTRYFSDHGATEILKTPIAKVITDANVNFLDIKKLFEKTDDKYDKLVSQVKGLKEDLEELIDEFQKLQGVVITKKKSKKKDKATRTRPRKAKQNILSVFKEVGNLAKDLNGFRVKVQGKIEEFLKDQESKLDKFKNDLEIKLVAALPVPTQSEDIKTKEQAAKEKAETIKQYKVKVEQTTKKGKAAALLTTNAAKLGTNLSQGDISAATNDPVLRKIAGAIFDFNTVGVDPKSPKYKQAEDRNKIFLKEIDTLRQIDTYVSVVKNIANDVSNYKEVAERLREDGEERFDSFVEELKEDYTRIIQSAQQSQVLFEEGGVRGVSPIFNKLLQSFEKIFSGDAKPDDIIKEMRNIIIISKSDFLSETLQSQPVVRTLQSFERKYLVKTKVALEKVLGVVTPQEEQQIVNQATDTPQGETPSPTGPIANTAEDAKEAIEQAKKNAQEKISDSKLYKALFDMYKAISEGKGSIISQLIMKLVELLKQFEAFIKKQIGTIVSSIKKKVKDEIDKNKDQYEKRLQTILKRKVFLDLLATSLMFNVATQLFWTGSSWQNSVGTTFQILFIQPMKRLKVNGRIDGREAVYRELARNLQKQLLGVQGLCIPNPATGIPPFPFKGYK